MLRPRSLFAWLVGRARASAGVGPDSVGDSVNLHLNGGFGANLPCTGVGPTILISSRCDGDTIRCQRLLTYYQLSRNIQLHHGITSEVNLHYGCLHP